MGDSVVTMKNLTCYDHSRSSDHDGSLIRIESEWYISPLSKVEVETKVYDVLFKEVWCSRGTCFVAKGYRQC